MYPQRLPIVDDDDGVWGDILRNYLLKEHYDTGNDNAANGGHKNVTIRPGTAGAGGAPLKFTSGTLLTTPEVGAMEFAGDNLYLTQTSGATRKKVALYDDASGATGDMYYRNSSGSFTRLAAGAASQILTISGGIPTWQTPSSSSTFSDATFTLQDDGDATKQARFQLSGITTATTRTYTLPNATTTLVGDNFSQTLSNKTLTAPRFASGGFIADNSGNEQIVFTTTASAVNEIGVTNAAAGVAPQISARGGDTNVNLNLTSKGTGRVQANGVTIPTISSTDILTNKTLDGSTGNNTFTNIPASALVDGPGSNLDADRLDGVEGASYLREDTARSLENVNYLTYNASYAAEVAPVANAVASAPFGSRMWHDLFAFMRNYTWTYETYDGAWSTAPINKDLFAQKEDQQIFLVDQGIASPTRVRWTVEGLTWSRGQWLVIGFTYGATSSNKTVTVETSADGSTWTQRHESTTTANAQVRYFFLQEYEGDTFFRLTITRNDTNRLAMSFIALLSSRSGDQGNGRELESPLNWDADRNITIAGNLEIEAATNGAAQAVTTDAEQTLINKTIDAGGSGNSITNLPTTSLANGAVTSAKIADNTIVNTDINASAAIALSKLATGRVEASVNGTATNTSIWRGTQAQYDAIATKDSNTIYFITS